MDIGEKIFIENRRQWRIWLRENYKNKKEVWLIYYKKLTGRTGISYDDSVEEALCFGWIDSIIKKIDEEKYARKFTPRDKTSNWSAINIERAKKMIRAGKMTKAGLMLFKNRKEDKSQTVLKNQKQPNVIPDALLKALKKDKIALENFSNFAPGYQRLYIAWINAAKKQETIDKRIKIVVENSSKNIKPGIL